MHLVAGDEDLRPLATQISSEARQQYLLGFAPSGKGDVKYRVVFVSVAKPGSWVVRTRRGYRGTAPAEDRNYFTGGAHGQVKVGSSGLDGGALLLGIFGLTACASKTYVGEEVAKSSAATREAHQRRGVAGRGDADEGQAARCQADHGARQATREALERAQQAGKLAEGKFVYSLVLSDDAVKFPVNKHELSKEAEDDAR